MFTWLSSIVDVPAGYEDMLASGSILAALAALIFLFYVLSRLFK